MKISSEIMYTFDGSGNLISATNTSSGITKYISASPAHVPFSDIVFFIGVVAVVGSIFYMFYMLSSGE